MRHESHRFSLVRQKHVSIFYYYLLFLCTMLDSDYILVANVCTNVKLQIYVCIIAVLIFIFIISHFKNNRELLKKRYVYLFMFILHISMLCQICGAT